MAGYIGRLIEQHGLPVYSTVIYLHLKAGRLDPGRYRQDAPGFEIAITYRVIRLAEVDGQGVLEAGHSGLIPFAPLMKRPAGLDSAAWLRLCVESAATQAMDRPARASYLVSMLLLSGLSYEHDTLVDIFGKEEVMGLLEESSFAQHLTKQGIERATRQHILAVLEVRFGSDAAGQMATRIDAIDDPQRLEQLLRAAVRDADLAAFGRRLPAPA